MNLKEAKFLRKLLFKTNPISWLRYSIDQFPQEIKFLFLIVVFVLLNSLLFFCYLYIDQFGRLRILYVDKFYLNNGCFFHYILHNRKKDKLFKKRWKLESCFEAKQSKQSKQSKLDISIIKIIRSHYKNVQNKSNLIVELLKSNSRDQYCEKYQSSKEKEFREKNYCPINWRY